MRVFKIATTLAIIILATQGHAFDLTHLALKKVTQYVAQAQNTANKPASTHGRRHNSTASVDPETMGLPPAGANFSSCRDQFANGEPPLITHNAPASTRALCFTGFAVLHSGATKTPVYSAEVLNRARIEAAQTEPRTDIFFSDARLPAAERATLEDYKGSTFDRGHNSPAADMDSAQAMAQSFSLANMMPQAPENNRKAWADIEKATRSYVRRARGNVYVITGPVFNAQACPFVLAARQALEAQHIEVPADDEQAIAAAMHQTSYRAPKRYDIPSCSIGNGVKVPSHIYKLVYDAQSHRSWAHWIANTDTARVSAPISYEELVKRTGINFLPGVQPADRVAAR